MLSDEQISVDQSAIDRVLAGDSSAYAEIVEQYQRRLLGLMIHASGDRELAEDIVQEAFTKAYQKLPQFAGESQFYTWLARIAMNQLISNRRRRRLESQLPRTGMEQAVDTVGSLERPEDRLEQTETQRCVQDAMLKLDEERRVVLVLRDFDGMDYEAIAETLQIPIGTVRSRLHRARLELRNLLQDRALQLGLSAS
ncbi:RNA polymerase sigma factor [Aureliella helgolandensis]|uniref:ECF RNA polymerase sigma factor SigW n=1 Tax=Aureliella helgolandensis TaxID=2527968 RepID=A0A518G800_9BACT|nr:sigma-70 family RNA polymerase sigma factor [Aureliella helgolandensis]QDV24703.1 ECF RNA polymerase sigma factor SigW [Aureliella helgolandensis]